MNVRFLFNVFYQVCHNINTWVLSLSWFYFAMVFLLTQVIVYWAGRESVETKEDVSYFHLCLHVGVWVCVTSQRADYMFTQQSLAEPV